jgi:hypothetical protein
MGAEIAATGKMHLMAAKIAVDRAMIGLLQGHVIFHYFFPGHFDIAAIWCQIAYPQKGT